VPFATGAVNLTTGRDATGSTVTSTVAVDSFPRASRAMAVMVAGVGSVTCGALQCAVQGAEVSVSGVAPGKRTETTPLVSLASTVSVTAAPAGTCAPAVGLTKVSAGAVTSGTTVKSSGAVEPTRPPEGASEAKAARLCA